MQATEWILLIFVAAPLVGALSVGLCHKDHIKAVRGIGSGFSLLTLAIWMVLLLVLPEDPREGLLVSVNVKWIPSLGAGFHLGLDYMGFMMAGVTSLVAVVAIVGAFTRTADLNRSQTAFMLLAEAGMLGLVASWDMILFIAFWEMTLVPFFFLMGRGSSRGGVSAASRFVLISVVSSVLMWVGVLGVVESAGYPRTFDLAELTERLHGMDMQLDARIWLFAPAFLVRMAAVPLHTWYPTATANVTTAAGIMLSGGVLPLGGYGIYHVLCRLFGPALCGAGSWLSWLGLATCIAGALMSVVQRDIKRLFAYICLSQVGLALIGIVLPGQGVGNSGLIMLMAVSLEGCSLFLFAGVVCQARGSQRIVDLSGLWRTHPFFTGLVFAAVASASAIPGTLGFVGALQILESVTFDWLFTALTALGILLTGMSMLWVFRRVLGGSYQHEVWTNEAWPKKRQVLVQLLIAVIVLVIGIFPGLLYINGSNPSEQRCISIADPDEQTQHTRINP